MTTTNLPRDFKLLSSGGARPSELTLTPPAHVGAKTERVRTILSMLHAWGDSEDALQLRVTGATLYPDDPADGLLKVSGKARTCFGEMNAEALFNAVGELTSLDVQVDSPGAEPTLRLGGYSGFGLRVAQIRCFPGLTGDRVLGYILGYVRVVGVDVPVGVTMTDGGHWTADVFPTIVAARALLEGRGVPGVPEAMQLDAMVQSRPEFAPFLSFLRLDAIQETLKDLNIRVDELQTGFTGYGSTPEFYRIKVGGASTLKPWKIIDGKLEITGIKLDMAVRYPFGPREPRFETALDGKIKIGESSVDFRLSNRAGHWLLTPQAPIDLNMSALGEWLGEKDFNKGAPDWIPSLGKLSVVDLALGVDLDRGDASVSLLQGGLQWTNLCIPFGAGKEVCIAEVGVGLAIEHPFSSARRRTTFSFGCRVNLEADRSGSKKFVLSGWVGSGRGWEIKAECTGSLSLTDALQSLVNFEMDSKATSLFGDVSLSLYRPSLTIGAGMLVDIRSEVQVRSKSTGDVKPFPVGIAKVVIKDGQIGFRRDSSGRTSYTLNTGVAILFDGGPKIKDCSLWVTHESAKDFASTSVTVSSLIDFPQEGRDPIELSLLGRYTSGDQGGFSFGGAITRVPLNPVINGMLKLIGLRLPTENFPELEAVDLRLSFDTATGAYTAGGEATTALDPSTRKRVFKVGDTAIEGASFKFDVSSSCKGESAAGGRVYLQGSAKINGFEVSLTVIFDGKNTDVTALFKDAIDPAQFSKMFPQARVPEQPKGGGGDVKLKGLGFYYRSTPAAVTADAGRAPRPVQSIAFFVDLDGVGKFDTALQRPPPTLKVKEPGLDFLFMMRPKVSWLEDGAEVGWSSAAFTGAPLHPEKAPGKSEKTPLRVRDVDKGFFAKGTFKLQGTTVGRFLGTTEGITVAFEKNDLSIDVKGKETRQTPVLDSTAGGGAVGSSEAPKDSSKELTAPAKPPEDKPGEKTFRFDTTLSPAPIINKFAPAADGASTAGTWREYVGNCLVVSNIGVTLHSKPRLAVTVFADIGVNVGTWVGVAAKEFSVKYYPAIPAREEEEPGPKDGADPKALGAALTTPTPAKKKILTPAVPAKTEFGLKGAALSINIPPWFKGGAAVIKKDTDKGFEVMGMGEVMLMQKFRIGALMFLQWDRATDAVTGQDKHSLAAGFGFVYVTGLTIVVPPLPVIMITGIAGGFGYRAIPKLPTRAEDVPKNELMRSLRAAAKTEDSTADGMIARLGAFRDSIQIQDDAWCIVFGLSLTVAQVVKVALLVVAESRKTGLELAIMGVANFTLGTMPTILGEIELSVLARFSSSAGTLTVLGAVTGDSWIFDKNCKLQGGFAVCFWLAGEHAGDFLISLGGYSPLVPTKAHYPALDRVGFKWQVSPELSLYGLSYLTLDRHGLQVGCASGLKYTTSKVKVDAQFSFDALVEWAPLYYEARLRMSVHVEIKVIGTLRLGLDVDMHLWGPPFGAKVHVELQIGFFNPSFSIDVGDPRELAWARRNAVGLPDVVDLAAGGKDASTFKLASGGSPAKLVKTKVDRESRWHRFEAERPCSTDDVNLSLETAIPVAMLYREYRDTTIKDEKKQLVTALVKDATGEHGLQLRARAWERVASDLVIRLFPVDDLKVRGKDPIGKGWDIREEEKQPLESLWCIPNDPKKPWDIKERKLITTVNVKPAEENSGKSFKNVRIIPGAPEEKRDSVPETAELASEAPRHATSSADLTAALGKDRSGIYGALTDAGFKLGECPKKTGFRPRRTTRPLMTKLCPDPVK